MINRLLLPLREPYRFQQERLGRKLRKLGFTATVHDLPAGRVHAWEGGKGPTVVLLQGFGSDALMQWSSVAAGLAATHRVIMPDMLWFGLSEGYGINPTLEQQAAAVEQLLDQLHLERAHLVGSSYGGFVAWSLASQRPERVGTLTLVGSPGNEMTLADVERMQTSFKVAHAADLMVPVDAAEVRRLVGVAVHPPSPLPRFVVNDILKQAFTEHRAVRRVLIEDLLARVHAPPDLPTQRTLLVWGRHDPVFPIELAERLALRMGDQARLHVIERAAHAPHTGRPREVIAALKGWWGAG